MQYDALQYLLKHNTHARQEEININLTNFSPHPMAMLTLNYRGSVHTTPQL